MRHSAGLCIADFNITLQSDVVFQLEEGYLPFIAAPKDNPDLVVSYFNYLPDFDLTACKTLFEASNDVQKFYTILDYEGDFLFLMYNQSQINEIQQIAMLSADLKLWKLYAEDAIIFPLKYPCGPIMMHYLTLNADAVMMHASCAFDGTRGRMFSGFSGVGKSTMSRLWAESGCTIINDDRLIIRKKGEDFLVYNTPMYYPDEPKVAPLHAIFLISHSPVNRMSEITGAMAVSRVMAYSIQNNFDRKFVAKRLDFFSDLCAKVKVFDLGFVPDHEVVNFIRTNE
jgi:hypothetical protein